jgi:hypothetical protein
LFEIIFEIICSLYFYFSHVANITTCKEINQSYRLLARRRGLGLSKYNEE